MSLAAPARARSAARLQSGNPPLLSLAPAVGHCPVCTGHAGFWRTKHTRHGAFALQRCLDCGLAYVDPRPELSELRRFYASNGHGEQADAPSAEQLLARERRQPNSTLDAKRLVGHIQELLGGRPAGRTLLDVGCGYGFFAREARKRGFEVTALELGELERERTQRIAGIQALPVAFEDFRVPHPYDALLMSQVLEHVVEPRLWIERARLALRPGGVLAIALPSFDSAFRLLLAEHDPFIIPPAHLNFFTRRSLRHLVESNGFRVECVRDQSRLPVDLLSRHLDWPAPALATVRWCTGLAGRALAGALDLAGHGQMLQLWAVRC